MKKCTVCGKEVNRLDYGSLTIKAITKIKILGEYVKNKQKTLGLILCNECRVQITNDIMSRAMGTKKEEEVGCNHDCVNCDGARI